MAYEVSYTTQHFTGSYPVSTVQNGIQQVKEIYAGWIQAFHEVHKPIVNVYENQTLSELWDQMIYNCCASVVDYDELTDTYYHEWELDSMTLSEIGWMTSQELRNAND